MASRVLSPVPLTGLGCLIRAADLDQLHPNREPKRLEHRRMQVAGAPRGYVEQITVDPEDDG
jgi:hypothetical protein